MNNDYHWCARRIAYLGRLGHGFEGVPARFRAAASGALMACAAMGGQACTLTADEYSPVLLEAPAPVRGTEDAEVLPEGPAPAIVSGATAATTLGARGAPEEAVGSTSDPLLDSVPSAQNAGAADVAPADAAATPDAGLPRPDRLLPTLPAVTGWASTPGLGVDATTGGGLAPPIIARTAAELVELAARPEPLTIAIEGTLEVGAVRVASNKTLVGIGSDATLVGGISISGSNTARVENVIIANLNVAAATTLVGGDAIQLTFAHHVWVDHCALYDAPDGLLDIVRGSDHVTVSHSMFFYTAAAPAPEHRFAALIGHDIQNAAEDAGRLNVTWHHNWWAEGVARVLTARFGGIHIYNNLFRSPGNDSVLSAGLGSSWLVENNHFAGVAEPHEILTASGAELAAVANVYEATSGARDSTALGFEPPYAYVLDSAAGLAARIMAEAGPH